MNYYVAITCLLALTASSQADGLGGAVYAPGHASLDYYTYPRYAFDYSVKDPHTGDNKAQWEKRDGDVVKGAYSLVEPDGSLRVVEYWADDKHGFNALVKRIGPNLHPTGGAHYAAPIYKAAIPNLESYGPVGPYHVGSVAKLEGLAAAPLLTGQYKALDGGYGGHAVSSASFYKDDTAPIAKPALPIAPIAPIAVEPIPIMKSAPIVPIGMPSGDAFPKSYYSTPYIPVASWGYGGKGAEGLGYAGKGAEGLGYAGKGAEILGYAGKGVEGLGYTGKGAEGLAYAGKGAEGLSYAGRGAEGFGYAGKGAEGLAYAGPILGGYKGEEGIDYSGYKGNAGPAYAGFKGGEGLGYGGYGKGGERLAYDSYNGYVGPAYEGFKGLGGLGYEGYKGIGLGYGGAKGPLIGSWGGPVYSNIGYGKVYGSEKY